MICDAHIHVGYFERKGFDAPFYYSPRRVCSVLRRCGVDEFIFSSTSMQTRGVVFADVHKESREVVKIWGGGAHPFLWVTQGYLAYDPKLSCLDNELYEGLKLHGCETDWLTRGKNRDLSRVLDTAMERRLPVVVHTGLDEASHPHNWLNWVMRYPSVRFDFAHGAPFEMIVPCLESTDNVFVDLSCVDDVDVLKFAKSKYRARVLWGTDFPVLSARAGSSLTHDLRTRCFKYARLNGSIDFECSFRRFFGEP